MNNQAFKVSCWISELYTEEREGCEECEEKHKVLNTLASAFKLVHDFFKDHQALPLPDEINKAAITQALAEDGYWECYHYGDYAIFGSIEKVVR